MRASSRSVAARSASRSRARARQVAIAAHDQPLAREVGRADLGQVPFVEQRELQRPLILHQGLDLRRPQAGDPVQPGGDEIVAKPGRGDHAAVAHQHHALDAEPALELVDLRLQRPRVRRVAFEHLDRDRQALPRAQQPIDDLRPVRAVIAAVAVLRQRAAATLEVGRRHVVKHQNPVLQMAPRQAVLDPLLALQKPIQRLVRLPLLHPPEAQNRTQARRRRLLVHRAHEAELRTRRNQPVDHHRHHQIARPP